MRATLLVLALSWVPLSGMAAEKTDPELERLQTQLEQLDADRSLAGMAGLERLKAKQALDALRLAKSRERSHALYLAERRVEAAGLMAQVELLQRQVIQLDREYDQLQIEASRREAEQARRDAERLRLQNLAREEEAERLLAVEREAREQSVADAAAALAEAEQANRLAAARAREAELARQEAELAAAVMAESSGDAPLPPTSQVNGNTVYTVAGNAFASGRSSLTASAQASLRSLGALLAVGSGAIVIEGHSDSQGAAKANKALSQQRAEAVLRALEAAGVSPDRMQAVGRGHTVPLADNATSAGRAQNRRVEVTVKK